MRESLSVVLPNPGERVVTLVMKCGNARKARLVADMINSELLDRGEVTLSVDSGLRLAPTGTPIASL
jgi:hypothetical protein